MPLRRSCQRSLLFVLPPERRVAAWLPTPAVRAARTCPMTAMGVCKAAMGVCWVSEKAPPQAEQ